MPVVEPGDPRGGSPHLGRRVGHGPALPHGGEHIHVIPAVTEGDRICGVHAQASAYDLDMPSALLTRPSMTSQRIGDERTTVRLGKAAPTTRSTRSIEEGSPASRSLCSPRSEKCSSSVPSVDVTPTIFSSRRTRGSERSLVTQV